MQTQTLMVQGTASDAGKSLLVTALCRWLKRRGVRVAPFKPQNIALNSAVSEDGGEIGRAQAVQARACGLAPHSDMNPILLKPNAGIGAQIVVQGRALGSSSALTGQDYKRLAWKAVVESYGRLATRYEAIVVEGAGSPAEINLRANDIANMGFAEGVDCPVILVADIDRGGVFAHLVGTLALLSESERARVVGLVVNRFRGDIRLLEPGLDWLVEHTGKPVLGVLPYIGGLQLPAEDAVEHLQVQAAGETLRVAVPLPPHIANHTDLDPLRQHPRVDLRPVDAGMPIPPADLIVLPGSKAVAADLAWLRAQGWESAIARHLRYGGHLIGLCGGYQMLGHAIQDPLGLEGSPGSAPGLGLLDLETTLAPEKRLANTTGRLVLGDAPVRGYEIHAGVTLGRALEHPALELAGRPEGALSEDGQILGTYLHGLFDSRAACDALLAWAGLGDPESPDFEALQEATLERLADLVETHLDTAALARLLIPGAA